MRFYIPTYEECLEIVDENPEMYFYERKYIIDNYKLSIFGYRYAQFNNFIIPLFDKPIINALELKGLSYIFNDDGTVFKHYLMLHKFWELNQYDHSTYNHYKDKKIKNITKKEDGFLITFIMLPSGDIISQSKRGFDTPSNILSNEYLENDNYYSFIKDCLLKDIQPIFELVGEKLYVKYDTSDLVLTKLRCNKTGKYLDINNFKVDGISVVHHYGENYNLNDILEMKKTIKKLEGWIIHFDDDSMIKIKTNWWINEKKNKNGVS